MKLKRSVWSALVLFGFLIATAVTAAALPQNTTMYDKGYRFDKDGWIYVHIEGEPYERGVQYGYLTAPELRDIMRSIIYLTYWNTGKDWNFFVNASVDLFNSSIDQECREEIKGIAAGAKKAGVNITWRDILTWNCYSEMIDYWWPNEKDGGYAEGDTFDKDRCSAFIATGNATKDGSIVIAHNTWEGYPRGQFYNVILDIKPSKGHRIFMQSIPGHLDSFTDFFMTDVGLVGTETTIGGFKSYEPHKTPTFLRVRKAMQYADTMNQFVNVMKTNNSGGVADTWLLGDINTGKIMRFELGLNYSNVTMTNNGYFIGFNAPIDPRIRNLECSDTGYADIRDPHGARQVRLTELMQENYGRIDAEVAKAILADHYDVYLKKINPCSRTVDGHYELDAEEYLSGGGSDLPFFPDGTLDGKVANSTMAKNLSFLARWGSSSGMPFNASKFLKENIQYDYLKGYLKDHPTEPWALFTADTGTLDHHTATKDL